MAQCRWDWWSKKHTPRRWPPRKQEMFSPSPNFPDHKNQDPLAKMQISKSSYETHSIRISKHENYQLGPKCRRKCWYRPGHIKYGWGLSMWLLRTALGKATNSSTDTGGAEECVWIGCDKLYSPSAVTSGKCQREGLAYSVLYTMNIFQVLSSNSCVCSLIVFHNDHLSGLIIPYRIPRFFFHLDCLFLHCHV